MNPTRSLALADCFSGSIEWNLIQADARIAKDFDNIGYKLISSLDLSCYSLAHIKKHTHKDVTTVNNSLFEKPT